MAEGTCGSLGAVVRRRLAQGDLNGWLWLMTSLGFGSAHLNQPRPVLGYVGSAVLPFYILHQPLIVVLG